MRKPKIHLLSGISPLLKAFRRIGKTHKRILPFFIGIIVVLIPILFLNSKQHKTVNASFLKFDEGYGTTTKDIQNTATGTLTGGTWASPDMCISGNCLYFNGINSKVNLGDNDLYDFAGTANFTISLWFRHTTMSSGTQMLVAKANASAGYKIQMESDGDLTFAIDDDASNFPDDTISSTAATYDDNKWHHLAAVKTGTSKIELYIDGALVASKASPTANGSLANTSPLYIGVDGNGTINYYQGYIDEVNIYPTTAKTATTVKTDAIRGASDAGNSAVFGNNLSYLSDGLVGYWKMDAAPGNLLDSSGNNYSLTNGGSTTFVNGKFGAGSEHVPGSSQYLYYTATTISGVNTVSFWTNPDATTNYFLSLTSGAYITATSGVIATTGLTNPLVYVNGTKSTTITADTWQQVTVTFDAINANQFYIGRQGSNYYDGTLDEVRLYNRILSPNEISQLYSFAPGPVGWWKLDSASGTNATIDSSGYNNATTTHLLTSDSWVPGKMGGAVRLLGTSAQSVSADDSPQLSITGDFTINFWMNTLAATTATVYPIVSKYQTSPLQSYDISQYGDEIRAYIGSTSNYVTTNTANLAIGTWYYVTVTYNAAAQSVKIYINNVEQATTTTGTIPTSIPDESSALSIGKAPSATMSGTVHLQVNTDGANDGDQHYGNYSAELTRTTLRVGNDGQELATGMRFTSVNVPQGATLSSATLTLTGGFEYSCTTCTIYGNIYAEAADNSAIFPEINTRPVTTNSTPWLIKSVLLNTEYAKDVTSAVQEVISRSGWNSGNSLSIILNGIGSDYAEFQEFFSYEGSASKAPKLDITYGGDDYFSGYLDDVRIYNYVRTPTQFVQDMNGGHPIPGSPIGSPMGYWRLDDGMAQIGHNSGYAGSAQDTYLLGDTFVCPGHELCPEWTNYGRLGGGLRFTQAGSSTITPGTTSSSYNVQTFTISTWLYRHGAPNASNGSGVVGRWKTNEGAFIWISTDNTIQFPVGTGPHLSSGVTAPLDTWVYAAGTFDGTTSTIYINGKKMASQADSTTFNNLNQGFEFGSYAEAPYDTQFLGNIDEVKFYTTALTEDQIKADYNQGKAQVFGVNSNIPAASSTKASNSSETAINCVPGATDKCDPPIIWYKLDENGLINGSTAITAYNSSDYGGQSNLTRTSGNVAYIPGKYGSAISFNTPTCGSLNQIGRDIRGTVYDATFNFSLSGWVKAYALSSDPEQGIGNIVTKGTAGDPSTGPFNYTCYQDGEGYLTCSTYDINGAITRVISPEPLELNKWYHFAFVVDTVKAQLYLNGNNVHNVATTGESAETNSGDFAIGAYPNCRFPFQGAVDNLKFYQYTRTAGQVALEYNQGAPVARYKFDDCSVNIAHNAALDGNGNAAGHDLILQNAGGTFSTWGLCDDGQSDHFWAAGHIGKYGAGFITDGNIYATYTEPGWDYTFTPKASYSMAAWVKFDSLVDETQGFIIRNDSTGIIYGMANGDLGAQTEAYCVRALTTGFQTTTTTGANLTAGTWVHLACTVDNDTGIMNVYVNGQLKGTSTSAMSTKGDLSDGTLEIGSDSNLSFFNRNFVGMLDEVQIFKYPLTLEQVRTIYNQNSAVSL